MPNNLRSLALITLIVSAIFVIWPGIDLAFSRAAYGPQGFVLTHIGWVERARLILWDATLVVLAFVLAMTLLTAILRRPLLKLAFKTWGFTLTVYLLGPGLLVNGILKSYWGRARPGSIIEFGGDRLFSRAYAISDQCAANCSFVSGEGAGTTAMCVALWMILQAWRNAMPGTLYRSLAALIIALPILSMIQRVGAGAHFASDALLSSLFVLLIAAALWPRFRPAT